MKKAWCYIRQSDNCGCFRSLRSPTSMKDWVEGYVIDKKIMLADLYDYSVFVTLTGEVWYYRHEATVSFKHPMTFIRDKF